MLIGERLRKDEFRGMDIHGEGGGYIKRGGDGEAKDALKRRGRRNG